MPLDLIDDIGILKPKLKKVVDLEDDLGIFKTPDVNEAYSHLSQAETGGETDPWIRTKVAPAKGSSAYGPVQTTKGLAKGALKNEYFKEDEELQSWVKDKFIPHGELLLKHGKNKGKIPNYEERYDYGGVGDFSDNDKEMYGKMNKVILKKELAKNPELDVPQYWYGKEPGEKYRERYNRTDSTRPQATANSGILQGLEDDLGVLKPKGIPLSTTKTIFDVATGGLSTPFTRIKGMGRAWELAHNPKKELRRIGYETISKVEEQIPEVLRPIIFPTIIPRFGVTKELGEQEREFQKKAFSEIASMPASPEAWALVTANIAMRLPAALKQEAGKDIISSLAKFANRRKTPISMRGDVFDYLVQKTPLSKLRDMAKNLKNIPGLETQVAGKPQLAYAKFAGQRGGALIPDLPTNKLSLINEIMKVSPTMEKATLAGMSVVQLQNTLQEAPLIQEAKKHKTPEEFVKEQGEVYHGTLGEFEDFLPATEVPEEFQDSSGVKTFGTYFTDSTDLAKQFGDKIKSRFINKNKLLDLTPIKSFDDLVDLLPIDQKTNEWELQNMVNNSYYDRYKPTDSFYKPLEDLVNKFNLVSKLKEMGYEGLIYNDVENGVKGKTFTVFDPKQIKTKSQLTDIWNKAQEKPVIKIGDTSLTTQDVDKAISQYAHQTAGFSKKLGKTIGMSKFMRQQMGKPLWEDLTKEEQLAEVRERIIEDFKIARKEGKDNPVNYVLDRALDPLDPMAGVYKIFLKKAGATIAENGAVKLSPELKRMMDGKAQGGEKPIELKGTNVDAVVTKSAKEPGKWQATFLAKDGTPSGDVIRDTYEDAVEEARLTTGVLSDKQKAAAAKLDVKPKKPVEHRTYSGLVKSMQAKTPGIGLDDIAKTLEAEGKLKVPEDRNPADYLNELIKTGAVIPRVTKGDISDIERQEASAERERVRAEGVKEKKVKEQIRHEKRGFKFGVKVGRKEARQEILMKLKSTKADIADVKRSIVNYANERLEAQDRGKLLSWVANSKTKKNLAKALARIEQIEEKRDRNIAVSSLKKTIKDIDIKKIRPEYQREISNLTQDLDLVNRKDKTLQSLTGMKQYIETHPDNNIPPEKLQRLELLTKTKIGSLTSDDIKLLNNSIKHLMKLHDLKNKMIFGRVHKEAKEVINEAKSNLDRRETQRRDKDTIDTREQLKVEVGRGKEIFTTESYNTELITEIIDKEASGVIKKVLYGGINKGNTDLLKFRQDAEDYFKGKIDFDITNWSETFFAKPKGKVDYQKMTLPSGKKVTMTKAERIALSLHARNEKNLKHLLNGGFSFVRDKYKIHKIDSDDLQAMLDDITPEEKKLADIVHHYFNNIQKAKLNERSMQLNGWEIATEPDYFPIRTNALDVKRDDLKLQKNFSQRTLEGMGILKERTNASNAIILEDVFSATYKTLKEASAYYGLAKHLRNAKMLLNDKYFQIKLASTYGSHYVRNLKQYLKDMEDTSHDTTNVEKLTLDLINKLDTAVLGLNPWVMAKQPVSLAAAATEIDISYLRRALKPASKDIMSKYSPQLRDRFSGNVTRELGEIGQIGEVRKFFTGLTPLSQKVMKGISSFDYQAIGRIWTAAELETNDCCPLLKDEERMQRIAGRTEEIVRKTQPTFLPKDRSAIGRSKRPFVRLLTKYSSQRNKNYMMVRRTVEEYNRSGKTGKDKKKMMSKLSILAIVMPAMLWGIDAARRKVYGRKEKAPKSKAWATIMNFLEYNLGSVYFVGNAFRSLRSKVERGTYAGYDVSDVLISSIDRGIDGIAETVTAIRRAMSEEKYKSGDKKGELKWKTTAKRAIDKNLSTLFKFKWGLPYDTVKRLVTAPFKWFGKEESEGSSKKSYGSWNVKNSKSKSYGSWSVPKK